MTMEIERVVTGDLNKSIEQCVTLLMDVERKVHSLKNELATTLSNVPGQRNLATPIVGYPTLGATMSPVVGTHIVQTPLGLQAIPLQTAGLTHGTQFVQTPLGIQAIPVQAPIQTTVEGSLVQPRAAHTPVVQGSVQIPVSSGVGVGVGVGVNALPQGVIGILPLGIQAIPTAMGTLLVRQTLPLGIQNVAQGTVQGMPLNTGMPIQGAPIQTLPVQSMPINGMPLQGLLPQAFAANGLQQQVSLANLPYGAVAATLGLGNVVPGLPQNLPLGSLQNFGYVW